jgi:hypothetical protein
MNYRNIHEEINRILGLTPNLINTLTSLTDNSPNTYEVLATVDTANLSLFGVNYLYFDSYTYPDVYEAFNPTLSTFELNTLFVGNDSNKNVYNVTTLHNYILSAERYLSTLPCIDITSNVYVDILINYTMFLLTKDNSNVSEIDIEGKYKVKMDTKGDSKNIYYENANNLSGGCLSKSSKSNYYRLHVASLRGL